MYGGELRVIVDDGGRSPSEMFRIYSRPKRRDLDNLC